MATYTGTAVSIFSKLSSLVAVPWYGIKTRYRRFRITRPATRLLGPQYVRSRDAIEIDITYVCNLRCMNCNRSITQAPEKEHMPLDMIEDFVRDSIAQNKRWRVIRVLGGEPTLHPRFLDVIQALRKYRQFAPTCSIQVVSNGYGKAVKAMLEKIPADVVIENSAKDGNVQPAFGPFNMAPADDPAFRAADYANGCSIMTECGMGLTPSGYYQCAVAGGIDRLIGKQLGYATLPADSDDMLALSRELCRLCGHFKDGHMIPATLRPPLLEEPKSEAWVKIYADWKRHKRSLRTTEQDETQRVQAGSRF